jgi:hypothetical protein
MVTFMWKCCEFVRYKVDRYRCFGGISAFLNCLTANFQFQTLDWNVILNTELRRNVKISGCSLFEKVITFFRSQDSVVGIATGYGLEDREVGVRVPVASRIFSSPRRPAWLWSSPNLLSGGSFPGGKAAGA